jgi:signal peptidase I
MILVLRWAIVEPFVIPSESMVPNLLVHDHILVKKFSFGLKVPFVDKWLIRWSQPQPGDIIVFKYPQNPNVYYVKRLIGVPGDKIKVSGGRIVRNGEPIKYQSLSAENYTYKETLAGKDHTVIIHTETETDTATTYDVPEYQYFLMGDNRDNSSDSRVWGFVTEDLLVGKAWMIWLSCQETLEDAQFICDPLKMRWNRIFNFL